MEGQIALFAGLSLLVLGVNLASTDDVLRVELTVGIVAALLTFVALNVRFKRWWPPLQQCLDDHTAFLDKLSERRPEVWIAVASGAALFAELLVIRWHGAEFQLFGFFKNASLLACFLGMGIGFTRGSRGPVGTPVVLPALSLQLMALHVMRHTSLDQIVANPISEELTMGLWQTEAVGDAITTYGLLITVFVSTALAFIPLGHLISRIMSTRPRLVAYGWNLLGSFAGIAAFYAVSMTWAPPAVWIIVLLLALLPFLRPRVTLLASVVSTSVLVTVLCMPYKLNERDIFSPYQVISIYSNADLPPTLAVNHSFIQQIRNLTDPAQHATTLGYNTPYLVKPQPGQVLVLGAGTGNDVSAALQHGAESVDAVEIDPALMELGRLLHPNHPYQNPRTHAMVGDARNYLRRTDKQYDLILYGLLDSHTLLSGLSSVRLDSFVYTVEGFREARAHLKENGVIALSFALLSTAQGRKLKLMLQEAFDGKEPAIYHTSDYGGYLYVTGRNPLPADTVEKLRGSEVTIFDDPRLQTTLSTDDWPFFYMPVRKYPWSYVLMIVILLASSALLLRQGRKQQANPPLSWPCFFLGAGFMLVETKAVTELALTFGTTWVVIGAVIAAILLLGFLANALVMRWPGLPLALSYSLIGVALALSLWLTTWSMSGVSWLETALRPLILTSPLFFSGYCFSTEVSRRTDISNALSANLLGAMCGGLLEYNAMYFGYSSLYYLAMGLYLMAFVTSLRAGRRPIEVLLAPEDR